MLLAAPGRWFFLTSSHPAGNIKIFYLDIFPNFNDVLLSASYYFYGRFMFVAAVIMPLIVFCLSLCFKSCCKCQNSSPSKSSTQDVSKSESCVVNINNYYHSPVHGVFTHCNIPNSIRAGTNSIPNSNNQCIFVNSGSINSLTSSSSGSYFSAISEV